MTKALLPLEDSYDRGCHASVEPHVAGKHQLSKDITFVPPVDRGVSEGTSGNLARDNLLRLIGAGTEDDYGGLVPFTWTTGVIITGGECPLGPDVLQVLGVGIVYARLVTVELELRVHGSSLKVTVRRYSGLFRCGGNVREGSCEHISAGNVRLRVEGCFAAHTHDLIETIEAPVVLELGRICDSGVDQGATAS